MSVGENGGCITYGDKIQHKMLGNKGECIHALATIQARLDAEIKRKTSLSQNDGSSIRTNF